MAVTAPVSLQKIVAEFGGPANLSAYTRGGTYVPNSPTNAAISTTVAGLAISQFLGAAAFTPYTDVFTSGSATITAPAGATSCTIKVWGAGGGAGYGCNFALYGSGVGGGGGGGAYSERTLSVTGSVTQFFYSVGAGGIAGTTQNVPPSGTEGSGTNGGESSVTGATVPSPGIIAGGGGGGTGASISGFGPNAVQGTGGAGGTAEGGTTNTSGTAGSTQTTGVDVGASGGAGANGGAGGAGGAEGVDFAPAGAGLEGQPGGTGTAAGGGGGSGGLSGVPGVFQYRYPAASGDGARGEIWFEWS